MRVTTISLRHFRNYQHLDLSFENNITIFSGNNAQGKTNLLEAIYIAAVGRSHRTSVDAELINWQQDGANVEIGFLRKDVENSVSIRFVRNQNKSISLNSHPIKTRDLIGNLTAVLFSPEDLTLVKGAPALRRRFLDIEISQTSRSYYQQLLQYNRILQQRNNLLKKIRERRAQVDLLETWDKQLAVGAAALVIKRKAALKKVAMLASLMHRKITDGHENLSIVYYQPYFHENSDNEKDIYLEDWYLQKLQQARTVDFARGITTIGPHRDDLVLAVNGINLRTYGSQGQQRTGVLALKLAELEFIKSESGEYPILLLDDVMSELDGHRRDQLLNFIKDRIQTFITATDEELFHQPKFAAFFRINQGQVMR